MEFLLEIYTEEMPSSHVKAGLSQLKEKIGRALQESGIGCPAIEAFGTCRRLVVVGDFAPGQTDRQEIVVGPPRAVAFGGDGSPTAAAKGFAKSQGAAVESLQVVSTTRGEYVGLKKTTRGRPTGEVLAEALPGIIGALSFPKMMRWGEVDLRFTRPIRNIMALWNGNVLPFTVCGIQSNAEVAGHKLRSPHRFQVGSVREYRTGLKRNKVILSAEERKRIILHQMEKRLEPLAAQVFPDEGLLEKLAYDVEHPYVFRGDFPREYLRLPLEVLSMAMREGQSLFSVVQDGRQLPCFLGVADALKDPRRLIRRGNERVLRARLEDARFFWEQDLKVPLSRRAEGLKQVIFQEKLGTFEDKRERLKHLVAYLCDRLEAKTIKKDAVQAADLCKVDLLTEMVREFPGLQGRIGGLYAREEGLPAAVYQAVYEHYRPVGLDDALPSSLPGAVLALADKIDSIVGVVGVGGQVSGSSDPFGLRRQATGVCRIILERKLDFRLDLLLEKSISSYGNVLEKPGQEISASCRALFEQRLRFIFESQGYRYDLISGALGAGIDDIYRSQLRLKAIDRLKKSPSFEPFILMAKRVNNILPDASLQPVNEELFLDSEEKELWSALTIIRDNVLSLVDGGEFARAQDLVFRLQQPLNIFFDKVLVMAEDRKLRQNRLAVLGEIRRLLLSIADYSQVVVEGDKKEASA